MAQPYPNNFLKRVIYLKVKSFKERENLLSTDSLPRGPQKAGLRQAKARSQDLYVCLPQRWQGTNKQTICCFPRLLARSWVWSGAAQTQNQLEVLSSVVPHATPAPQSHQCKEIAERAQCDDSIGWSSLYKLQEMVQSLGTLRPGGRPRRSLWYLAWNWLSSGCCSQLVSEPGKGRSFCLSFPL